MAGDDLVDELSKLRGSGLHSADSASSPLVGALVGDRLATESFGEAVARRIVASLEGMGEHPHRTTALQLFGLDAATLSMNPRESRKVAVARTRGSATPANIDAF